MANYYGSARSNYFRVKDKEVFLKGMENLVGIEIQQRDDQFIILGDDGDGYNWNVYETTDDDYESIDLPLTVAKYLADDEVAIFIEAGWEKLRYCCGRAVAVNNKHEETIIDLNDIYECAAELTDQPENVTRAEY